MYPYQKKVCLFSDIWTLERTLSNPDSFFDESEWRRCGDTIWDQVTDGDKLAKKLQSQWHNVMNCLQKYKMEQVIATMAATQLGDGLNAQKERPIEALATTMTSFFSDLKISPGVVVPLMGTPNIPVAPAQPAVPL